MQVIDSSEQDPVDQEVEEKDPLARFRSWPGFLFAALVVNVLFAYAMTRITDASVGAWYKALVWLPFNAIATAVYVAIMLKLARTDRDAARADGAAGKVDTRGALYAVVCIVMIVANWLLMLVA